MTASYVLTTFSPAMFGEKATSHIRLIDREAANHLVNGTTRIVASRVAHERLARNQFPNASEETARYATLKPDTCAILVNYRGAPVPDDGSLPPGGQVLFYLIEVEEYQET